jgi:MFS family permease
MPDETVRDGTRSDDSEGPLWSGYSGRQLIVVSLGTTITLGAVFLISPLMPAIIHEYGLSASQAGGVLTALWALNGLGRYPGGRLADRLSHKTVLVSSLGLATVGCGALMVSGSYPMVLLSVATIGLGAGLYYPAGIAQLSTLFSERRGRALGANVAGTNLGGVLASGFAFLVLGAGAWRPALIPFAIVLLGLLAVTHRFNAEPYVVGRPRLDLRETAVRLSTSPQIRWILVAFILFAFAWQGSVSFLPTYLQVDKGFSPSLASSSFAVVFLVGIVANPVVGALGDRFGHAVIASATALLGAVGLGVLLIARSLPSVIASITLFAVGITAFWTAMSAFAVERFPDASMGGDFGAVSAAYVAIESLGSTYVGVVADIQSHAVAYAGLIVCLLVSAAVTRRLARE